MTTLPHELTAIALEVKRIRQLFVTIDPSTLSQEDKTLLKHLDIATRQWLNDFEDRVDLKEFHKKTTKKYLGFKCPNCDGYGLLYNNLFWRDKEIVCPLCWGKGYLK